MLTVVLPSGREILIPATPENGESDQDTDAEERDFDDVAFRLEFQDLVDTATEIGVMLRKSMEHIRPQRATVELSVGIDARTGHFTAFFVDGGVSGAMRLTLEWGRPQAASK